MTKIITGYAQPDIVAEKGDDKIMVFVETPTSLRQNAQALKKSILWIKKHEPNTRVDLVHTVPKTISVG